MPKALMSSMVPGFISFACFTGLFCAACCLTFFVRFGLLLRFLKVSNITSEAGKIK